MTIRKVDANTEQPLPGAEFKVTTLQGVLVDDNEGETSTGGIYRTDASGEIHLAKLLPGGYRVAEVKAPDGYALNSEAQTVTVNANDHQTLVVKDVPLQSVTIHKFIDGTNTPLSGVTFKLTFGDGTPVGGGNGEYVTDASGEIRILDLTPGAVIIAREIKTVKGYTLNTQPQTIIVGGGSGTSGAGSSNVSGTVSGGSSMNFYNSPQGSLVVRAVIDGTDREPLKGVTFQVVDGSGAPIGGSGEYVTDAAGTFTIENLEPGLTVNVREIKVPDGFVLDGTPKSGQIRSGEALELVFQVKRPGGLILRVLDSLTEAPVPGTAFKVLYADGRPVDTSNGQESSGGQYVTDSNGEIHITGIVGTVVVAEEKSAPGYTMDANNRKQTVEVRAAETQALTFHDAPDQSLTLQLYAKGTTNPISGARFQLTDGTGSKIGGADGTFTTDAGGRFTVSGLKPGTTVNIRQISTAAGFVPDAEEKSVTVKSGDAQSVTVYNTPTQGLTVQLYVKGTTTPIPGAQFQLTDGAGTKLGDGNGTFTTDQNGRFSLADLAPGLTVNVKQISTTDSYLIDGEAKTITIKEGNQQTVTVYNTPKQGLTVQLYAEGTTDPISGARFLLTDSKGTELGSEGGAFLTDEAGRFTLNGIAPGVTVRVKQISAVDGFLIDGETKTITIESGDAQTLTVYNKPTQSLTVRLFVKGTETPIPGAKFLLTDGSGMKLGNADGEFTTDEAGRFSIGGLTPGSTVKVEQVSTAAGYLPDAEAKAVTIQSGDAQTVTVYNTPTQGLTVQLYAEGTSQPIPGARFYLTDSTGVKLGAENGEFTTDKDGRFSLTDLAPGVTVNIKQLTTAAGYIHDGMPKTITIDSGDAQTVTVYNAPQQTFTVQLYVKGTTTPIPGARFLLTDGPGAKLGDEDGEFTTDEAGRFTLNGLTPGMTVKVKQISTTDGYLLDSDPKSVTIKAGNEQTVTMYNSPAQTLTIRLYVKGTTTPIPGAKFLLRDSGGKLIGEDNGVFTTDQHGEFSISGLTPGVTITATQTATVSGYVLDGNPQDVFCQGEYKRTFSPVTKFSNLDQR